MQQRRRTLRPGLDIDVYQVVKKWKHEGTNNTVGPKPPAMTVVSVYDAIKRSNSSLARQKRKNLEDSIERVLNFMSEESSSSDSSDTEEATPKKQEERFLLNRQLTKHWNVTPLQKEPKPAPIVGATVLLDEPVPKKRRIESGSGTSALPVVDQESATARLSERNDVTTITTNTKKRSRNYLIERIDGKGLPSLGGLADVKRRLDVSVFSYLVRQIERQRPEDDTAPPGKLLAGPPGIGKRSLVMRRAAELGIPLVSLSACIQDAKSTPERLEKMMMDVFDQAKRMAPSVLFIPDAEKHLGKSGSDGNDVENRVMTQFQRGMEDLKQWRAGEQTVIVVGTTAQLESVNPDILATDMFNEVININVPGVEERIDILKVLTKSLDESATFNFDVLGHLSHGFVGSDLANAVQLAKERRHAQEFERNPTIVDDADGDALNGYQTPNNHQQGSGYDLGPLTQQHLEEAIAAYVPYMRREGFTIIPDTTWSMVGAMHHIREGLEHAIIGPIQNPRLYEAYGLGRPQNALLWGPPGCGKTLIAKAVANATRASFILINGPELLNKYVGESERAIRELFSRARSCAPCLLFFDEIDSLAPRRENTSTEASARVVNALLTELDGAVSRKGVYVIGTTNRPDMMDTAMLRPGRFDNILFVDLPSADERVEILRTIYRTRMPTTPQEEDEVLIEKVARDGRCENFSGADLQGLCERAATAALMRASKEVGVEPVGRITKADWDVALRTSFASVADPQKYRDLVSVLRRGF